MVWWLKQGIRLYSLVALLPLNYSHLGCITYALQILLVLTCRYKGNNNHYVSRRSIARMTYKVL